MVVLLDLLESLEYTIYSEFRIKLYKQIGSTEEFLFSGAMLKFCLTTSRCYYLPEFWFSAKLKFEGLDVVFGTDFYVYC